MISGHGNIETAVSAIKRGAYDYIEKPFKSDRLVLIAERALEASQLRREVKTLRARSAETDELIGDSAAMNQLRLTIERVAPTNSRVMIFGPSGAGKGNGSADASQALAARVGSVRRPQFGYDHTRSDGAGVIRYRTDRWRATQDRGP